MAEIDFDKILGSPAIPAAEGDPIKSIYKIIPSYDTVQLHLKFQLLYFVEKYDLKEWRTIFHEIDTQLQTNKNITLFGSATLKNLLSAYTQNELVRGVKVQSSNINSSNGGSN